MSFIEVTAFDGDAEVMFHLDPATMEPTGCYVFAAEVGKTDRWDDSYCRFPAEHFTAGKNPLFSHCTSTRYTRTLWKRWRKFVDEEDLKS